ncbi:MAG: hypothetical protein IPK91_06225 [Saprospiraceae bacterium]|nr:hypothetical protein [Saprospiraceae bacterium]
MTKVILNEITQDDILKKMQLMQEDCPEMFATPGARKNEICIGYYYPDFALAQALYFQTVGLSSARPDSAYSKKLPVEGTNEEDTFYPMFADAEEYIRLELGVEND